MWIILHKILDIMKISENDICFCWSWKKYKDCCLNNEHPSRLTYDEFAEVDAKKYWWIIPPSVFRNHILKLSNKCLICESKPIKSHTLSAKRLRESFKSNFVSWVLPDENRILRLTKVPINKASALPLRCKYHDEIFNPIDQDLNFSDNLHLNLLSYRTLWRDLRWLTCQLKTLYSNIVLYDFPFQIKLAELYLRAREMNEFTNYVYKWLNNTNWNWLHHNIYKIWRISPIFASWAIHYDISNDRNNRKHIIILNLIYKDGIWFLIVSYKNWDEVTKNYSKIFDIKKHNRIEYIKFLNEFIWKHCENIICDESRDWEYIQSINDWLLYEHWEHDYIRIV